MKLIIQIPCFNEADALPITLSALPRKVSGFDSVERLVIDDGSNDETLKVAKQYGVDHIVSHRQNRGLASAFMSGIEKCLTLGADVIVNTDADNQYNSDDIPALTLPILEQRAEFVVGVRQIDSIDHFSLSKKMLQKLGSWVVRRASKTDIEDVTSGFRAFSRTAAQNLTVYGQYTYTLETIIQAGQKKLAITSVPIRVNRELRPSRLITSIPSYIWKSIITIIRIFVIYRPFRFFASIGIAMLSTGIVIGLRFMWFYLQGKGDGHIQSLILGMAILAIGFQTILTAFVVDSVAANRKLLEDIRMKISIIGEEGI